jgi:hypothetical protein
MVYVLIDPRKQPSCFSYWKFNGLPFYVGRTRSMKIRYEQHLWNSLSKNRHKNAVIAKILKAGLRPEVRILKSGLSIDDANFWEQRIIHLIGRSSDKRGPLTNQTDGGDGGTGRRVSMRSRKRLSSLNRDKWLPSHLERIQSWSGVFDYESGYSGRHKHARYTCALHGSVTQIASEATHAINQDRPPCPLCGKLLRGINISRAKQGKPLVRSDPGKHVSLMRKVEVYYEQKRKST